jgi:riboflavin kinase / FMN adenylyltransferase
LKIYRDLSGELVSGTVATIGIFDGVHLAHKQIIERLIVLSKQLECESLLITLWPHPRYVLNKNATDLKLLTTLEEKLNLLETAGVDNILLIPFDMHFASTAFDKFIKRVVVDKLRVKHLVVGFNHQFGRDRQGNFEGLSTLAGMFKFKLEQMPKVEVNGQRVSSSIIRQNISEGKIELANKMLGYAFLLSGKVVHGNKIGRNIGFPTANIEITELYKIIPANGVYAVTGEFEDTVLKGMVNIGIRPTIDDHGIQVIEANFFNFDGNLYDKHITLKFHKRIREEKKFSSLEQLKNQIERDKTEIQFLFKKFKESK